MSKEVLPPPMPVPKDEQISSEDFLHARTCVRASDLSDADSGYFLPGDTVKLVRSNGQTDDGWAFVGSSAIEPGSGVFVKIIDDHRASKIYPYNWEEV